MIADFSNNFAATLIIERVLKSRAVAGRWLLVDKVLLFRQIYVVQNKKKEKGKTGGARVNDEATERSIVLGHYF